MNSFVPTDSLSIAGTSEVSDELGSDLEQVKRAKYHLKTEYTQSDPRGSLPFVELQSIEVEPASFP